MHRDALGLIFAQQKEEKKNSKFSFCLSLALSVTLEKSTDLFMCKFPDPKVGNNSIGLAQQNESSLGHPRCSNACGVLGCEKL